MQHHLDLLIHNCSEEVDVIIRCSRWLIDWGIVGVRDETDLFEEAVVDDDQSVCQQNCNFENVVKHCVREYDAFYIVVELSSSLEEELWSNRNADEREIVINVTCWFGMKRFPQKGPVKKTWILDHRWRRILEENSEGAGKNPDFNAT